MSGSIYDWDITAANNDDADGGIDWSEGMSPGNVNDSGRQMMGREAEFLADTNGTLTAGGTANALTLTTNSSFTAYKSGLVVAFKAASDNSDAVTLNVNTLGAKSVMASTTGTIAALNGGEIVEGNIYVCYYDSAANSSAGAWILGNPTTRGPVASQLADSSVDWNDITEPGWHNELLKASNPNGPNAGNYFYCLVVEYSGNLTQIAVPYSDAPSLADGIRIRGRLSGTWSAWQTACPNEDGNNANGYYVKFPSGLLLCWSLFVAGATTWTFPAAFGGGLVGVYGSAVANGLRSAVVSNITLTQATFHTYYNNSVPTDDVPGRLFAIGRWTS